MCDRTKATKDTHTFIGQRGGFVGKTAVAHLEARLPQFPVWKEIVDTDDLVVSVSRIVGA